MNDSEASITKLPIRRPPWNKGKLIGAKPPLRPSHVWSIRTKLLMGGRKRDLALFNLPLDSKLRGCEFVAVRNRRNVRRKRRAPSLKVTSTSRCWGRLISKARRVGVNSTSRSLKWPA